MIEFNIQRTEENNGMVDVRFVPSTATSISFSAVTSNSYFGDGSNLSGITDTYVTGVTFNPTTYILSLDQNGGQPTITSNLSVLASDVYVVSGVYNPSTGIVTYTNSSGGTFQVSGFTTGMTDSYTTAANLNGETIEFNNNIQGPNLYSVNLSPILSGKTDNTTFNTYTANTLNILNGKIDSANNVGGANEVFKDKSGTTLNFRTISAGTNTSISTVGDVITIDSITAGGGASVSLPWKFNTSTIESDPSAKFFRFNNSVLSAVTEIYVNDTTNNGIDSSFILSALDVGDNIYIQQNDDASKVVLFGVSGETIDNGGWFTIPVTYETGGDLPTNNKECGWVLFSLGAQNNTVSNVGVGQGVYKQKVGSDFEFYSLSGGSNTTLSLNNNTIVFDVTIPPDTNTFVTGFTYNDANTFTISRNDNVELKATINTVTGLTINGNLTVTGNTNLDNINVINLSATTINPVDYIQFNTAVTGITDNEGRIYWDSDNGTLSLGMENTDAVLQIGQEQYYYIKNQSGATIENGRVVRAAGTLGASGRILGEYMIADGTIPPKFTLGLATENILNGEDGYVTEFGLVRGFDTTGTPYGETWNDGDVLWVSPTIPGGLTNIEPVSPDLHIEVAIVIFADANGSVFVRPHRYPYSYDIQDMGWSGGTENNLDIIQWNSSLGYFELTNTPTLNSLSANTINSVTFSGGTFYGDGSGLTNITVTWDGLETITVGENVISGDLLYLSSGGTYLKTSNTTDTTCSTELRIATETILSGQTGNGLIQGKYTTTGLTQGDKYWVGATSGTYTNIQPNGDGDIVRYVGTALNSTTLEFMPDETWIEISSVSTPTSTQPAIINVTTSYSIGLTDYTINVTTTGDTTQTLPDSSTITGKIYNIKNSDSTGTSTLTIATTGGELIDGLYGNGDDLTIIFPQSIKLQSTGSGWIII
jgi:hypothetical protein